MKQIVANSHLPQKLIFKWQVPLQKQKQKTNKNTHKSLYS